VIKSERDIVPILIEDLVVRLRTFDSTGEAPIPVTSEVREGHMTKRKLQKQSANETLAEVIKEMAKPRVAMSARGQHIVRRPVLIVKNNVEK
jgi:hypothetical protein